MHINASALSQSAWREIRDELVKELEINTRELYSLNCTESRSQYLRGRISLIQAMIENDKNFKPLINPFS